jgi:protein required for attachment to host cells
MESTWFVVADRSQAQLFEVNGPRLKPTLVPIETLESQDRGERRGGLLSSSSGRRDLLAEHRSGQDEQDHKFVRQLVERLAQAQHQRQFGRLVIAAPADFVGKLREATRGALQKAVVREIIGDYTNDTVHALQERARRHEWLH